MKIIALIADDQTPTGWVEIYDADTHSIDLPTAEAHATRLVNWFNSGLRGAEIPRRLLSVELKVETPDQAYGKGRTAYACGESINDNYFKAVPELADRWEAGWLDAEASDESENEDDED